MPRLEGRGAGFTLAEVVVVILLLALMLSIGSAIFIYNNRFYETQTGEVFSITATREAADRINEYGRQAVGISNSYIYNFITYTTGAQTVIFQVPSLDSSNQVITGSYDYVIIGANPGVANRLELIVVPAAGSFRPARNLLLSDKLTALNYTYNNPDLALARRVDY